MPRRIVLCASLALSGCAATEVSRVGADVLAAGAGGVVAEQATNGNPYWTLAGGVTALGAAEWARSAATDEERQRLALAYERGRAQNVQLTYEAIQNAQKDGRSAAEVTGGSDEGIEIPITAPERTINGVRINASTEYIRISTR